MKIAINPSTQFGNRYVCAATNEGAMMGYLGGRIVTMLNLSPDIEARLFWRSGKGDPYAQLTDEANAWGADYLVSLHTDSAGDRRGYTGSLICYHPNDPLGARLGRYIQKQMAKDFNWPIAGELARGDLYVLTRSRMPSVLIELANHSDPDDCRFILANPELFTKSVVEGILAFTGHKSTIARKEGEDMFIPVTRKGFLNRVTETVPFVHTGSRHRIHVFLTRTANIAAYDLFGSELGVFEGKSPERRIQLPGVDGAVRLQITDPAAEVEQVDVR